MPLFQRKKVPAVNPFPPERYEPVLRKSICTGETTACMRDRETGKVHEVMLIRSPADLRQFARDYDADVTNIKTVY